MLRDGAWFEKHMMTKLLRCCSWSEAGPELVRIACTESEHWLVREGALYALAELGSQEYGAVIHGILLDPDTPLCVRRVAVATLARLGYRPAVKDLWSLTVDKDDRMKIFANRALLELGVTGDIDFLLNALENESPVIREEVCGALALAPGNDVSNRLSAMEAGDTNASVRSAAFEALLYRNLKALKSEEGKLSLLKASLDTANRQTASWIVRRILAECGEEGLAFVRELASQNHPFNELAAMILVFAGKSSQKPEFENSEYESNEADEKHGEYTHTTFADYAVAKAKAWGLPVEGNLGDGVSGWGMAWQRLHEGAAQEDESFLSVSGEIVRQREHAYNPTTNKGFNVVGIQFGTARDRALSIWNDSLLGAYSTGDLYSEEVGASGKIGGAWQLLGRISHLLQDMTAPLHGLAIQHVYPSCKFENAWKTSGQKLITLLDPTLSDSIGILYSESELPEEALTGLDDFSRTRLAYWLNSNAENTNGPVGCPNRFKDDVRGYIEVLAWISYFRTTVWGEVWFNKDESSSGSTGNATSSGLLEDAVFSDITVPAGTPNGLHAMFAGKVKWRDTWNDNYFTLECANGNILYWMKTFNIDDWGACDWVSNRCEGYKLDRRDHDDQDARTVGRFWLDTREIDPGQALLERHPDGTDLGKDMYDYYADTLFPLTVRYNAGLIHLANRRVTIKTRTSTPARFEWSRSDNFGKGPIFETSSAGSDFFFAAKSNVTLTAPLSDVVGGLFTGWEKNGIPIDSTKGEITINSSDNPISIGGDTYIALFEEVTEGEDVPEEGESEGELSEGEGEIEGEGGYPEGEGEPQEGEGELTEGEEEPQEGEEETLFHPADIDKDFQILINEAITYLVGWQQGNNPIGYAVRAAYLWQNGQAYMYKPDVEPPLCWILAPVAQP